MNSRSSLVPLAISLWIKTFLLVTSEAVDGGTPSNKVTSVLTNCHNYDGHNNYKVNKTDGIVKGTKYVALAGPPKKHQGLEKYVEIILVIKEELPISTHPSMFCVQSFHSAIIDKKLDANFKRNYIIKGYQRLMQSKIASGFLCTGNETYTRHNKTKHWELLIGTGNLFLVATDSKERVYRSQLKHEDASNGSRELLERLKCRLLLKNDFFVQTDTTREPLNIWLTIAGVGAAVLALIYYSKFSYNGRVAAV